MSSVVVHDPSQSDAGTPSLAPSPATSHRGSQMVILLTSAIALVIWVVSGAPAWQGYPVDHPHGPLVAGVLGVLALTILGAIGRLAVSGTSAGLGMVMVALIGWTASRITLASILPLISDEAYHWMWAKHFDLGYYDHPGMVAWMGRLFWPTHGSQAIAARLSPICLSAGIVLLVYTLARMLTGSVRVATRSALALMLIPMFHLGFMLLIPSVALNLFWLAALIFAWRATQRNRTIDWVLTGIACGGAFNSNFTTFVLPACVLAYLLVTPRTRRLLLTPGPYLAILGLGVAFIPTLIWNAQHDWATIVWNFAKRHDAVTFRADGLAAYLGELLAFVSPVLMIVMIWLGGKAALTGWRQRDPAALFLAVMGFGPLLIWLGFGCIELIVAYYAAPAFAPLLILCTRYCTEEPGQPARPAANRWHRRGANLACLQSAVMAAGIISLTFIPPDLAARVLIPALPRTGSMWMADLFGWPALGQYLDSFGVKMNTQTPLVAIGPTYAQASLAMYHSRSVEMAYALDAGTGRYGQQFVFWAPLKEMPAGCDAIVFRPGRSKDPARMRTLLLPYFETVEEQDVSANPHLRHFLIFHAKNYKGGLENHRRAGRK